MDGMLFHDYHSVVENVVFMDDLSGQINYLIAQIAILAG